eukprot:6490920-Amphidinium_carterae.2
MRLQVTDNFLRKKTANAPPSGMGHEIEREASKQRVLDHEMAPCLYSPTDTYVLQFLFNNAFKFSHPWQIM